MSLRIPCAITALLLALPAGAAPWCTAAPPPASLAKTLMADAGKRAGQGPRAVARLHTEGTLPHQGIWDQSVEAKKDLPLIRELALAWRSDPTPTTLAQLATLLDAWSKVYQPSFNPIDETDFDAVIDAFAISQQALPAATREATAQWIRALGEGYIAQMRHPAHPGRGTWTNNWQSHRIKLATLAAVALDDDLLFAAARAEFRRQLGQNLLADGSTIDFGERDALHYTVYDLEPLTRAAMAAATRGEEWLHLTGSSGASLASALDWLLPYARGDKTHEEYVHTAVKFDLQRRDAGVPGFGGMWEPRSSSQLYWLASTLDARYRETAQRLSGPPAWLSACWGISKTP